VHTPNSKIVRTADATAEPLSLAVAKGFLRVEITDDDALISTLITAARYRCEAINNRSYVTTSWQLTLDYFPPYSSRSMALLPPAIVGGYSDRNYWLNLSDIAIELPYPPLLAVTSITYLDQSGASRSLDLTPGVAVSISTGTPGQITPHYGTIFPITQPTLGAVQINYTAGYGPDPADVPPNVMTAMMFLVAHYYEHRTSDVAEPAAVKALLGPANWGFYG
jgi:hypothetical protein